jgi:diadenosine tetraphosphate (Ap4A) HIT family hydrolase
MYEDDGFICIEDLLPAGKYHYLIIPKRHISHFLELDLNKNLDKRLLDSMVKVGRKVLEDNLDKNQKFIMGFTRPAWTTVGHLHLHCVSQPFLPSTGYLRRLGLTSNWIWTPFIQARRELKSKLTKNTEDHN